MTAPINDWESAYLQNDPAPWDIGRPQPAFAELADEGLLVGNVLDAGCGTGEHALLFAARGARVTGIDLSATAIQRANDKAAERGLTATFRTGDILSMQLPPQGFDAVVDSGLFHVFTDEERARYVAVLGEIIQPGGVCCLMCFSDRQPGDWGPRRVTRDELEAAFADGWVIDRIEPSAFDINPIFDVTTAYAWLAVLRRADEDG
jgi:cyclopropane fatty-acyl-phospholipid synthase-like methyltransferase